MEQRRSVYAEARLETLSEWLTWLEETKNLRDFPEVAAFGACTRASEGDAGAAERLSLHAFTDDGGRPKEDSDLGPFALMLRSCQAARGYFSSAIVFTVAARLAAHQGHPEDARTLMSQAIAIRPRLSVALPFCRSRPCSRCPKPSSR